MAASNGDRVAVVALRQGLHSRPVGRFGPVRVVRLPGSKRRGSFGTYVVEYMQFLVRAHRLMRHDARFREARVVHVHSLPDFLVAAARPARRRGARVVLDLHEILPEFAASKYGGWAGRLAGRLGLAIERWSRRQADVTLTVNHEIQALLAARAARRDERIEVIHNLTSEGDFGPARLAAGSGAGGAVRLAYHGTLTALYGVDLALHAVARARSAGVACRFDVYGAGPQAEELVALARALSLGDAVTFHGMVSHLALRTALPTHDAGLITTRLDGMTRYSLSTKLLEYVHLGIPVIAPRIPTYLRYFPEEAFHYFTPGDAADAARAIGALAASDPAARIARARAAQAAMAGLDWATEAGRLRALYDELLGRGGQAPVRRRAPN